MSDNYTELPLSVSAGEARTPFISDVELVNLMVVKSPPGSVRPFYIENALMPTGALSGGSGLITGVVIHSGLVWYVRNATLYAFDGQNSAISIGNVSSGFWYMTGAGPGRIFLCNGAGSHYVATTSAVTSVTTPQTLGRCTSQDGYVIAIRPGTDEFYVSNLDDATTWGALNYSTFDAMPDELYDVKSIGQKLVLFGRDHIEFWYNAGAAAFPFVRSSPGVEKVGVMGCVADVDGVAYFVGKAGRVYALVGYQAQLISSDWVERDLGALNKNSSFGTTYFYRGQTFYVPHTNQSTRQLVYSITNGAWHRLTPALAGSINIVGGGNLTNPISHTDQVWVGVNYIGTTGLTSGLSGLSGDTFLTGETVGGNAVSLPRTIVLPPQDGGGHRLFEFELELVAATAIYGIDFGDLTPVPTVEYETSDDGGVTFYSHGTRPMSDQRKRFHRCGSFHRRTRRLTFLSTGRVALESIRARLEMGL